MMQSFKSLYTKLNKQQKKAVDIIDGPVLIVAGPGTGKTTVLTMRIANILLKTDVKPANILALTFTESGVKSMRQKLISLIGEEAYYVNINTFHSFASEIISEFPEKFSKALTIEPLSDFERVQVIKNILDSLTLENLKTLNTPYYYLSAISSAIQTLKREGVDRNMLHQLIKEEERNLEKMEKINPSTGKPYGKYSDLEKMIGKHKELLLIYEKYSEVIRDLGRYDFEDMISFVLERLKIDEDFRLTLQERYHYFLIDEYQDTNTAQNELIMELASYWGQDANIFAVGDDEQAIYRFQGASLENILTFKKRYPNAQIIVLDKNYRSDQILIDATRDLIRHNEERLENYMDINKSFKSSSHRKGRKIRIASFEDGLVENYFIVHDIRQKLKKGVDPSEIAILVRTHQDALDIREILSKTGIEYDFGAGDNLLAEGIIIRLINLFKLIENIQQTDEELPHIHFNVLNYEFVDVNRLDVLKLAHLANKSRTSLFETIIKLISSYKPNSQIPLIEQVKDTKIEQNKFNILEAPEKIISFYEKVFEWSSLNSNITFIELFETIINESGYLNWILKSEREVDYLNLLNSLFDEIKKINYSNRELDIRSFIKGLQLMEEHNIRITPRNIGIAKSGIKIITAHKSKGLEFDYIYLAKVVDKKWGNNRSHDKLKLPEGIIRESDLGRKVANEDERRLFYVALTRTKKEATILYSSRYSDLQSEENVASIFLTEIPKECTRIENTNKFVELNSGYIQKIAFKKRLNVAVSNNEDEYIDTLLEHFRLNPTALNTYLACPYRFKINTLFRVPRAKSMSLKFGTAIHYALEKFFRRYKGSNKVPPLSILLEFLKEKLQDEIFTPEEFERALSKGEKVLTKYYETYKDSFAVPLYLEQRFGSSFHKATLGDIPLSGNIDKVEIVDLDKKKVRVVDYKTGRAKTRNEILGKTKNSNGDYFRQLLFYKLLTQLDNNFNLDVVEGELDFVEHLRQEIFEYREEDLVEFKGLIKTTMNDIRNHKFERTTDKRNCQTCEYKDHCWPDGIEQ